MQSNITISDWLRCLSKQPIIRELLPFDRYISMDMHIIAHDDSWTSPPQVMDLDANVNVDAADYARETALHIGGHR